MQNTQNITVTRTSISFNKFIVNGKEIATQSSSLDPLNNLFISDRIEIGDFSGKNLPKERLVIIDEKIFRINSEEPIQQTTSHQGTFET
jgi:hypothetical protein